MQSNEALVALVLEYRAIAWQNWKRVTLSLLIALGIIVISLHAFQAVRYLQIKQHDAQLQVELEELHKEIGEHLSQAKELTSLTHLHSVLTSQLQITSLLKVVSEAIPDRTLLTSLRYRPGELSLEGYAPDFSELELFLASLRSHELLANLRLTHQSLDVPGIKFVIQAAFGLRL